MLLGGCALPAATRHESIVIGAAIMRQAGVSAKELGIKQKRSRTVLMVCAPSNAAIDEIIFRIKSEGIVNTDGSIRLGKDIKVVRVGRGGAQHEGSSMLDTSAEELVQSCSLENLALARRAASTSASQTPRVDALKAEILKEADIICCTLSAAGSSSLLDAALRSSNFKVSALIIDEATQATEPSTLIPFKYKPDVIVLAGDPRQLRPTVLSRECIDLGYNLSLFERLHAKLHVSTTMLRQQYRMHPAIAAYPSLRFYDGRLLSGYVTERPALGFHTDSRFLPVALHQVFGKERRVGQSLTNADEVKYAVDLYSALQMKYPEDAARLSVGIITPYAAMRDALLRAFTQIGTKSGNRLSISTIDGFQGRERDIVIFCSVRSQSGQSCCRAGFVSDPNRINVAITRAKHALWLVGNFEYLGRDEEWGRLIVHARETSKSSKKSTSHIIT